MAADSKTVAPSGLAKSLSGDVHCGSARPAPIPRSNTFHSLSDLREQLVDDFEKRLESATRATVDYLHPVVRLPAALKPAPSVFTLSCQITLH